MKICILAMLALFCVVSCASNQLSQEDNKRLKQAAIDCDVAAFSPYMPNKTAIKINEFDKEIKWLNQVNISILQRSRALFGDDVKMTGSGIRIPIDGTDPRWSEVFGPKWSEFVSNPANAPFYFRIKVFASWDQECVVVRTFQACIEDASFCSEFSEQGSDVRMAKLDDQWQLVLNLTQDQIDKSRMIKQLIMNAALQIDRYLADHRNEIPNEALKIQLAQEYERVMNNAMLEMRKLSVK